jgi:hypothetical protein
MSIIISDLERDVLVINGLKKDVDLIIDIQKGLKIKTKAYKKSLKKVTDFLKRGSYKNLKNNINNKNFSAWERLNLACKDNNQISQIKWKTINQGFVLNLMVKKVP